MQDMIHCGAGTEKTVCPECGSGTVMTGDILAMDGAWFVPRGQTTAIQKGSRIYGYACGECGTVFGLKLADPHCLERKKGARR